MHPDPPESWPAEHLRPDVDPDGWAVSRHTGRAGDLHAGSAALVAGPGPAARSVRVLDVSNPTVVLGSRQSDSLLDPERLARSGLDVAHRTSGGAAVLLGPSDALWVDVVVPVGDSMWAADVGRAGWWLGDLWTRALRGAGYPGVATWRGPLVRTPWSELLCFAGVGPGEVTVGGVKVVGLSQRRTRNGALLQSALLLRWSPETLLDVIDVPEETRQRGASELRGAAVGVGVDGAAVLEGFLSELGRL